LDDPALKEKEKRWLKRVKTEDERRRREENKVIEMIILYECDLMRDVCEKGK